MDNETKIALLTEQLCINSENMSKGMPKSIQRLAAKAIRELLDELDITENSTCN